MKIAIVASPRTGSTWLYNLIFNFLNSRDPQTLGLEEYFNVYQLQSAFQLLPPLPNGEKRHQIYSLEGKQDPPPNCYQLDYGWTNRGIERQDRTHTAESISRIRSMMKSGEFASYLKKQSDRRLKLLKREKRENIVVKLMAEDFQYNSRLVDFLSENFRVILLRREKTDEQFKSYCLSVATGVWGNAKRTDLGNTQFKCPRTWVNKIESHVSTYNQIRQQFSKAPQVLEVTYEQLCEWKEPSRILKGLGIFKGKLIADLCGAEPAKTDYIKYFSNANEVSAWVRDSR